MNFKLILALIGMNILFSSAAPRGRSNKQMYKGNQEEEEVTVYETEIEYLTVAVPASAIIIENETPAIVEGDELVYLPEEAFDGVEYILEEKLEESKLEKINDDILDDKGEVAAEIDTSTQETENNEPIVNAFVQQAAVLDHHSDIKLEGIDDKVIDNPVQEDIVEGEEDIANGEKEENTTDTTEEEETTGTTEEEEEEDTSGTTEEEEEEVETTSTTEEEEDTSGTTEEEEEVETTSTTEEDTSGTTEEEEETSDTTDEENELENDEEEDEGEEVDEEEGDDDDDENNSTGEEEEENN